MAPRPLDCEAEPSDDPVVIAVVVACVVALLTAGLLIPFEQYAHYVDWSPRGAIVGCFAYLVVGGLAGLIGWAIGTRIGLEPVNEIARGAVWGALGASVVRIHFNRLPKPDGVGEALSLANTAGTWTLLAVEWAVKRSADRQLENLDDPELAQYVSDMFEKGMNADRDVGEPMKKAALVELTTALSTLDSSSGDAQKQRARSHLRSVGRVWIMKYRFAPPRIKRK
jgi:hypothetical protein